MTKREAIEVFNKRMDCKDAYQADPSCDGNCSSCEYYASAEEEKEAMQMAISALEKQEQDRWNPVTERLPEEDGEYLVTFDRRYAEEYALDDIIGIAPFEVDCEGFGIWQERFHPVSLGSLGSEWVDIPVTAWRPLPEAYETEEVCD